MMAESRGWPIRTFTTSSAVAQQENPRGLATLLEEAIGDQTKPVAEKPGVRRRCGDCPVVGAVRGRAFGLRRDVAKNQRERERTSGRVPRYRLADMFSVVVAGKPPILPLTMDKEELQPEQAAVLAQRASNAEIWQEELTRPCASFAVHPETWSSKRRRPRGRRRSLPL